MSGRGSSFYWAMRLLGRQRREAMFALYGFCREMDDIADDGLFAPEERLARLEQWRERVRALYDGAPDHELTRALAGPVAEYGLAQTDLLAVIDGVAMDAQGLMCRPSQARLDLYCDRVASAVGRLAVRIFGVPEPRGAELAAVLGRALQLTNILRDLAEDGARGRLYLPDELLSAHGIQSGDPQAVLNHPALPLVCRDLARMAHDFYVRSWRIMAEGPPGPMRPSRLMASIYQALLVRMEHCGWPKGQKRVSLPVLYKLWLVACSIGGWGFGLERGQTDLP